MKDLYIEFEELLGGNDYDEEKAIEILNQIEDLVKPYKDSFGFFMK